MHTKQKAFTKSPQSASDGYTITHQNSVTYLLLIGNVEDNMIRQEKQTVTLTL